MKTKTFDANSWHCELAQLVGHSVHETTDICQYTRRVIGGALVATIMTLLLTALAVCVLIATGQVIYGILASLYFWEFQFSAEGFIGLLFYIVVFIAYIGKMIQSGKWKPFKNFKFKEPVPKEPGFIKQAYLSYKGKYCYPVETFYNYDKLD